MTVKAVPAGMVPDSAALFGLMAMMGNVNAYSQTLATVATAGTNSTLTAAQALAGCVRFTTGASGGWTATLPTTRRSSPRWGRRSRSTAPSPSASRS